MGSEVSVKEREVLMYLFNHSLNLGKKSPLERAEDLTNLCNDPSSNYKRRWSSIFFLFQFLIFRIFSLCFGSPFWCLWGLGIHGFLSLYARRVLVSTPIILQGFHLQPRAREIPDGRLVCRYSLYLVHSGSAQSGGIQLCYAYTLVAHNTSIFVSGVCCTFSLAIFYVYDMCVCVSWFLI